MLNKDLLRYLSVNTVVFLSSVLLLGCMPKNIVDCNFKYNNETNSYFMDSINMNMCNEVFNTQYLDPKKSPPELTCPVYRHVAYKLDFVAETKYDDQPLEITTACSNMYRRDPRKTQITATPDQKVPEIACNFERTTLSDDYELLNSDEKACFLVFPNTENNPDVSKTSPTYLTCDANEPDTKWCDVLSKDHIPYEVQNERAKVRNALLLLSLCLMIKFALHRLFYSSSTT